MGRLFLWVGISWIGTGHKITPPAYAGGVFPDDLIILFCSYSAASAPSGFPSALSTSAFTSAGTT